MNIVWFKRDLRIRDHEPLNQALAQGGPVLLLHVFEPLDRVHPTTSQRHLQFRWEAWQALCAEVKEFDSRHIDEAEILEIIQKESEEFTYRNKNGRTWNSFFWEGELKSNTYLELIQEV